MMEKHCVCRHYCAVVQYMVAAAFNSIDIKPMLIKVMYHPSIEQTTMNLMKTLSSFLLVLLLLLSLLFIIISIFGLILSFANIFFCSFIDPSFIGSTFISACVHLSGLLT